MHVRFILPFSLAVTSTLTQNDEVLALEETAGEFFCSVIQCCGGVQQRTFANIFSLAIFFQIELTPNQQTNASINTNARINNENDDSTFGDSGF